MPYIGGLSFSYDTGLAQPLAVALGGQPNISSSAIAADTHRRQALKLPRSIQGISSGQSPVPDPVSVTGT